MVNTEHNAGAGQDDSRQPEQQTSLGAEATHGLSPDPPSAESKDGASPDTKGGGNQDPIDQSGSDSDQGFNRDEKAQSRRSAPLDYAVAILTWTPKRLRWDPEKPHSFGYGLNILYAVSATFTVANLYYCQPILNRIADEFDVSYERSSSVATLIQSGYAAGLLFLCPLGDTVKRRPFIINLIFVTALLWLGLCITTNFAVFCAVSFLTGVTTVTPQLMLPLVGDVAPAHRRGTAISIVVSGLTLGMLVARLLSGILANYTHWRNIYWLAFGAQVALAMLLFFFMPDYPSTNPEGINYLKSLWSIIKMLFTEPILVQASAIAFLCSATFTSFWLTLTFLLASPPYEYDSLVIGLFSLIGFACIFTSPLYGRFVVDRIVSVVASIIGQLTTITGAIISTLLAKETVAGPILHALLGDVGIQFTQIANRSAIYMINAKARNRLNTAYMVAAFSGQLTGTALGNRLYAQGGWTYSAGTSVGLMGLSLVIAIARGPREKGWIGWSGGWHPKKDNLSNKGTPATPQSSDVKESQTSNTEPEEAMSAGDEKRS